MFLPLILQYGTDRKGRKFVSLRVFGKLQYCWI